jgi:CRP/FNR family transcriptional regulator, cyclic AMP receptor protein
MHEDTLAHVELFAGLEKKDVQLLAGACRERNYSAGSKLIKQGDTGVGLYVITAGTVHITKETDPDKLELDLGTVGPGNVLGEMSLLDDLPRSANVTAVSDVTALLLPVWEFRTTLRNHPDIALRLLSTLSRRLRKAESNSRD